MKMSYLYGACARDWWRLLVENRFRVSPRYLRSASQVTLLSLVNSWLHRRDQRIDTTAAKVEAPLFILGHWRSGTTHLQYLLSQDPRFASPNTYEVCFPNSLLCSEETHGRLLARFVPSKRPQDNMALGMAAPNEDEIALAALGSPSPYLYLAFPEREAHYRRFLSFRDATPPERQLFERGFDAYLRKLAFKHKKTLLLKSPTHTARVALLLGMYPDAKFVHICRHPADVFQSTRHLYQTWYDCFDFVQTIDRSATDDRIIAIYREMYDVYFDERKLVPSGQLHEMRFEDLEADPMGEIERLYTALRLRDFPGQRLARYLSSVKSYKKNGYPPLDSVLARRLEREWAPCFEAWGYDANVARRCAAGRSVGPAIHGQFVSLESGSRERGRAASGENVASAASR